MPEVKTSIHDTLYISTMYRLGTAQLALTCDALWGRFVDRITSKSTTVRIPLGDACESFSDRYDLLHFRTSEAIHGLHRNSVVMRGITHEAYRQWVSDGDRIMLRATISNGPAIRAAPEYLMDIRSSDDAVAIVQDLLLPKISHVARVDRYVGLMLSTRSTVATYGEVTDSPTADHLFPSFE